MWGRIGKAMAKQLAVSSARTVETLAKPGRHNAGDNLYLSITKAGSKRWVFLYVFGNQRRELGLGSPAKGMSLAMARDKAIEARKLINLGDDPIKVMGKSARAIAERGIPNFGSFADDYLATHGPKFRNDKHKAQWATTLETYCAPIRSRPIDEISTDDVLRVLQPIWSKIPETASRVRGRIENVLDAAKARGYRDGLDNPARWRGHLKALLPARQRLTRGHHAALPYDDLAAFLSELQAKQSTAALALELCILTATRSGEMLNAVWPEFDLKKAVWTIPAIRMKAGQEHRIPLTARAMEILHSLHKLRSDHNDHVFAGNAKAKPLSNMAMSMLLKRMGRKNITVHGFRSTFRDWASEQTLFPHETCEHALAHRISDKAEAAYRRGDQFEKRRKLMESWAAFCQPETSAKVVPMKKRNAP
jgi:integrase